MRSTAGHSEPAVSTSMKLRMAADDEARPEGFEPPTCGLEVRCSIQLSYGRFGFSIGGLRVFLCSLMVRFDVPTETRSLRVSQMTPGR